MKCGTLTDGRLRRVDSVWQRPTAPSARRVQGERRPSARTPPGDPSGSGCLFVEVGFTDSLRTQEIDSHGNHTDSR